MRSLVIGAILLVMIGVVKLVPKSPRTEPEVPTPDQVLDFDALYSQNCSGCHGKNGKGGPAPSLGDPTYLALADDATIRRIATNGVPGTAMSGFAESAGGDRKSVV